MNLVLDQTKLEYRWIVNFVVAIVTRLNKCIGDDTKAAARQSPHCIKKTKNMSKNDFQYDGCNSYTVRYGTIKTLISPGKVTAPCNVACGSGIMTVNSPIGSRPTVQRRSRMTCHWIRQVAAPCNVIRVGFLSAKTCFCRTLGLNQIKPVKSGKNQNAGIVGW